MEKLLKQYQELYGTKPVGRWAKDENWLKSKIAQKGVLIVDEGDLTPAIITINEDAHIELKESGEVVVNKTKEASVYNENGVYIRTYDLETHGKDYKKLAETFISSREGHTIR